MGLFSKKNPDERTLKDAGERAWAAQERSGRVKMHDTAAEFRLGQLAYDDMRDNEKHGPRASKGPKGRRP